MKVRIKQGPSSIDVGVRCSVQSCNPQGVWFSPLSPDDPDDDPVRVFHGFGFRVHESRAFPGVFVCPWESADDGDCYLAVLPD